MAKYIDAEKLRAEIERHRQAIRVLNEHTAPEQTSKTCAIFQYSDLILSELISFLDTLSKHPDKSLGEEIEMEWDSFNKHLAKYNDGSDEVVWLNWLSFVDIATYFYELGLKAEEESK